MYVKSSYVLASVALATLAACTSVPPVNETPDSIANAKTPADHQRIADLYAKKAAGYESEAAWHDKMARAYTGRPKGDYGSMLSHCHSLRDQLTSAANEAKALEQAHRKLAEVDK